MSTGNRITKPGFKAYQPVVAACQLGLNQIPPFIIHENFQSRADLTKRLTAHRVYGLFSELVIPIPCDLEFTYSSEGFDTWWSHWKAHLFHGPISVFMISIDPSYVPAQEELEEILDPKNIEGEPFQYMPTAQFLCSAEMLRRWRRSFLLPPRRNGGAMLYASHRPKGSRYPKSPPGRNQPRYSQSLILKTS